MPSKRPTAGQAESEASSLSAPEVRALWEEPTEGTDHVVVPVGIPPAVKRREDVNRQQAGVSSLVERIALDLGEVKATHHDWVGSLVHNSDPTQQRLEYDKHCPACVIKQILEAIKLEKALATAPPEQARCSVVLTKEGDRCAAEAGHEGAHELDLTATPPEQAAPPTRKLALSEIPGSLLNDGITEVEVAADQPQAASAGALSALAIEIVEWLGGSPKAQRLAANDQKVLYGHQHTAACYSKVPETEGKGEYLSCGKVAGDKGK